MGELGVKVFGGSAMISTMESRSKAKVGQQNITMVFHVLEKETLRIASSMKVNRLD